MTINLKKHKLQNIHGEQTDSFSSIQELANLKIDQYIKECEFAYSKDSMTSGNIPIQILVEQCFQWIIDEGTYYENFTDEGFKTFLDDIYEEYLRNKKSPKSSIIELE